MKILKIYVEKLRFKNYSERTVGTYSCYLTKFLELIENGDMIFCNVKFAKNLEEIANKHYKRRN